MECLSKIKILSSSEAMKIAAGEVVERPSSVVKELIENSIDAGSTQISLFIEKAGKKLIRVLDNGSGMSIEDAKLSVYPHATSKITSLDDLQSITTFGFRGEALAAISSVSKFKIITKLNSAKLGIRLVFDQGILIEESELSCANGTDIIIEDLFFNVPVRKKFLKQDDTEWNQIELIFNAFCLSHKDIHFKLYKDGKLLINAPVIKDLKDRIRQLKDNNFAENFISLDRESRKGITLEGIISNHQSWHYNKSNIYFFVNKRFVKNLGISKALIKGYLNVLPPDRFPAACIFIDISSKDIDVNVHPRKEEIKFSHPVLIETLIHENVKKSLENYITSKLPKASEVVKEIKNFNFSTSPFVEEISTPKFNPEFKDKKIDSNTRSFSILDKVPFKLNSEEPVTINSTDIHSVHYERIEESNISKNLSIKNVENNEKIIGQLLNTYILIENSDGLTIIDQHAAHERILYERFKNNFFKQEGTALMFPEVIALSSNHKKLLLSYSELLNSFGFDIEDFGDDVVAIKSSPPILKNNSLNSILLEIISLIEECGEMINEQARKLFFEKVHAMMSCKAAVKAGDVLNIDQMKQLIEDLSKCENRLICVHGRPTIWSISKNQLEKTFQRKI